MHLYKLKATSQLFAFKSIRKDKILENQQIEPTKLEKDILSKSDHPFISSLQFVFQTDERIIFVMQFLRGGELFSHLRSIRQFPEERARFYVI